MASMCCYAARYLCLVVLLYSVFGCSSGPQVLLFRYYLSDQEVNDITQKMQQAGLSVTINQLAFPTDLTQSTLIYSPMLEDHSVVDLSLDSIRSLGWEVYAVTPLAMQNHRFTRNTIGLYLLPEGQSHQSELVNEYQNRGCQTEAKIVFKQDNTYAIRLAAPITENALQQQLRGIWKVRSYPYVELQPFDSEQHLYFEMHKEIESDLVGKIEMTKLIPLESYRLFPQCHFVAGVRL